MTLSSTITKTVYAGDGAAAAFATGFKFLANHHVRVVHRDALGTETPWIEGTHYTIAGAGQDQGGTVTVTEGHTPENGSLLLIKRDPPPHQETSLPLGGAFPSTAVETALDRLTMLVQAQGERIDRAIALSEASSFSELTVPDPEAGKVLAWSEAADALVNRAAHDFAGPQGPEGPEGQAGADGLFVGTEATVAAASDDLVAVLRAGAPRFTTPAALVAAGGGGGVRDEGVRRDLRSFMLTTSARINMGRYALPGGWVDLFDDQTGIDEGASVGAHYNADGRVYANGGSSGMVDHAAGTAIGNASGNGGLSAAFDGVTDRAASACAMYYAADKTHPLLLGKDWGAGNHKVISKFVVHGSSNYGFREHANYRIDIKLQGSHDGSSWDDLAGGDVTDGPGAVFTMDAGLPSVAYRYHRIHLNTTDAGSGYQHYLVAELQFFEVVEPAAMTLPTIAFAAPVAPSHITVSFLHGSPGSPAPGTDFWVEGSRDDGATWEAATTPVAINAIDGLTEFECAVDVSGQPPGDEVRIRYRTSDAVLSEFHGHAVTCGE